MKKCLIAIMGLLVLAGCNNEIKKEKQWIADYLPYSLWYAQVVQAFDTEFNSLFEYLDSKTDEAIDEYESKRYSDHRRLSAYENHIEAVDNAIIDVFGDYEDAFKENFVYPYSSYDVSDELVFKSLYGTPKNVPQIDGEIVQSIVKGYVATMIKNIELPTITEIVYDEEKHYWKATSGDSSFSLLLNKIENGTYSVLCMNPFLGTTAIMERRIAKQPNYNSLIGTWKSNESDRENLQRMLFTDTGMRPGITYEGQEWLDVEEKDTIGYYRYDYKTIIEDGFVKIITPDDYVFRTFFVEKDGTYLYDPKSLRLAFTKSNSMHAVGNEREEIGAELVLQLCQFIPDHDLNPQAKAYMTGDFYEALNNAFRKVKLTEDSFGDGEFLFYFVTGNGGSKPYYSVEYCTQTDWDKAVAVIGVQDLWGDENAPEENADKRLYIMNLVLEDGQWLIDDFNGKKEECYNYIIDY